MTRGGKVSHKASSNNRQVQRTRSWIFEALMLLLEEKPYRKISISDITKKAGIARQTFYRNYNDKDDIVSEYLLNSINLGLMKIDGSKHGDARKNIILTFNLKYMMDHRENIIKLLTIVDIEHRIRGDAKDFLIVLLEQYKNEFSQKDYLLFRYKLNYQIVGCLTVFFDWFTNDISLPVSDILLFLNSMNVPKTLKYRGIPSIVVQIKTE